MAQAQRTILVVEDDHVLRAVLADALQVEDYRVIQACNAADGLRAVLGEHPDLILLDVTLHGRTGIDLLNEIKFTALTHEIPVLMMSGDALLPGGGTAHAADATLPKPFDLSDFLQRVDLLSGG